MNLNHVTNHGERVNDRPNDAATSSDHHRLTGLEIAATAVSGLLVAALLGVLVWDAVHSNASPAFTVRATPATLVDNAYRAEVTVRNTGDDAAKSVMVHVELVGRDSTLAESDLTIDWLPGRSSHQVVAYFPRPAGVAPTDVRGVEAAVHGYTAP